MLVQGNFVNNRVLEELLKLVWNLSFFSYDSYKCLEFCYFFKSYASELLRGWSNFAGDILNKLGATLAACYNNNYSLFIFVPS